MDMAGPKALTRHQGWDQRASPARVEPPAVITAFDLAPIEMTCAERHAAVWTEITQREGHAGLVAADHDRLAEHQLRHHSPAPQIAARERIVPGLAQWRGGVARSGSHRVEWRLIVHKAGMRLRLYRFCRVRPRQRDPLCSGRRSGYFRSNWLALKRFLLP